jgi:PAS domain S-box-containing protein
MYDILLEDGVLRHALARLNDVVLITEAEPVNLPGPQIVYVNAAFERMTGYTAAEVIGQTPRILQGPRTNRAELQRIREALEAWRAVRVCLTNYRKNGLPFDVEFEIVPVCNDLGWYTHWVSVQRDVTNRTLAEAAIRRATTFEALLDDASSEVILFTGATGAAVSTRASANDPWVTRHVIPADIAAPHALSGTMARMIATVDESDRGVVAMDEPGCVVRGLRASLAGGGDLLVALWREEAGDWALAAELLPPVVPRIAAAHDQLAVQREHDRLQGELVQAHKLEAVGRLAGGIAHDFNNLLMVITGNLELMREQLRHQLPGEYVELSEVLGAADRARSLVEHLLAFSHRRPVTHEAVDVRALILATTALLQRTLGQDIGIVCEIASEGALIVDGDAALMEQTLLNLAINARDAIRSLPNEAGRQRGIITIGARAVTLSHEQALQWPPLGTGRCIEIVVSDTGNGMSEEVRAKALEPFFTTKGVGEGTGLGLSSVYGTVRNLNGAMQLESAVPHGAVVRMRFPVGTLAADLDVGSVSDAAPLRQRTLLFVEDDAAVRSVMLRMLRHAGHRVIEAHNGPEALDLAATMGEELAGVISDVRMPGMSGIEMVRALRLVRPDVPVLFVSGDADGTWITEFGANTALLTKPFAPPRLFAALDEAFSAVRTAPRAE